MEDKESHKQHSRVIDSYVLEFLNLPDKFSVNDLKRAIVENLKDFLSNTAGTQINTCSFLIVNPKIIQIFFKLILRRKARIL